MHGIWCGPCVCLSVHLSVCHKSVTVLPKWLNIGSQTMDCSFLMQQILAKFQWVTPDCAPNTGGVGEICNLLPTSCYISERYRHSYRGRYRNSCALYQMVPLPLTLSDLSHPKLPQFLHFRSSITSLEQLK